MVITFILCGVFLIGLIAGIITFANIEPLNKSLVYLCAFLGFLFGILFEPFFSAHLALFPHDEYVRMNSNVASYKVDTAVVNTNGTPTDTTYTIYFNEKRDCK